jgi:pyridoxal 5'-phosphate synthase pdxT subunit
MNIGVLALQGDFREHIKAVEECGHSAIEVRRTSELDNVQALILPGGESTAIALLAKNYDLIDPIRTRINAGMPTYGSCAGMILLADRIVDGVQDQITFGGIDMTVRRNAFGRQVDSFESDLSFAGHSLHAIFIRAPWVEEIGSSVEVISAVTTPDGQSHPVAVRQNHLMATSFHPELTHDLAVHRYFIDEVCK